MAAPANIITYTIGGNTVYHLRTRLLALVN